MVLLPLPAGKWFVSTGKDNLLNAWRTPYGASIFQVSLVHLAMGARMAGDTTGRAWSWNCTCLSLFLPLGT